MTKARAKSEVAFDHDLELFIRALLGESLLNLSNIAAFDWSPAVE